MADLQLNIKLIKYFPCKKLALEVFCMVVQLNDNKITMFIEQIKEDVKLIQENYQKYDSNLQKDEYAFNYWVLSKLYNVDEDFISSSITEYNDKSIDCFVHFEDSKELYIIQNKFYAPDVNIITNQVSDFLQRPLAELLKGNYKRSRELQNIFNKAFHDAEYKIYFYFYTTSTCNKSDFSNMIEKFNKYDTNLMSCYIEAKYLNIYDIKDLYFGETFKNIKDFKFNFTTPNKATFAAIKEELDIGVRPAFYIITPISEIYRLYKQAQQEDYQIFNNNIREWLGDSPINKGIVETLNSDNMNDFLYYNNGITMIYESSETDRLEGTKRIIPLINPQIVNGCQTTNSIYNALNKYNDSEIKSKFKSAYVMVKALKKDNNTDDEFYENVMKYTNKQNSIPEKAFSSKDEYFYRIQKELLSRGFLLEVKPSDKAKYKQVYSSKKNLVDLLEIANKKSKKFGLAYTKLSDISIPLDKLLQIMLAFVKDGYAAYTKKSCVLKYGHPIYKDFSLCLLDTLTIDSILNIYLLHQKAEADKKAGDGRNPIPYYLISFFGDYFRGQDNIKIGLEKVFSDEKSLNTAYSWLKDITTKYFEKYKEVHKEDYNRMIKQKIDEKLLMNIKQQFIEWGGRRDSIETLLMEETVYI